MNKYDIAAIGELNVDVILNNIDGFPEMGKEKFAGDMLLTLGSSTAIFAANASSLGSKVCFVGMVGKDSFGTLVKESLEAKGVATDYLIENPNSATGATIVMSYDEDRANLTYQGAMDIMGYDDIDKSVFENTRHIHLSSLFMQSALLRDIDKVLDSAVKNGVTVSLDTQWDPAEKWALDYKSVLPRITIFLPNEKELQALTHTSSLEEAIEAVLPYLGCAMVVKMGSKGSLLVRKDGSRHFAESFLNKNVVDAIGAGDSFNSGFVSAFVKGYELEKCQEIGNMTGALNTTAAGGTGAFTSPEEIEQRAQKLFGRSLGL
ncbi:MAG: carbohydrate kinase family protein [Tidjanibacter sp.]|nr:carbohydrate kinase family protein [Tidjanibacter sp.]